jgi:hypothetical protein
MLSSSNFHLGSPCSLLYFPSLILIHSIYTHVSCHGFFLVGHKEFRNLLITNCPIAVDMPILAESLEAAPPPTTSVLSRFYSAQGTGYPCHQPPGHAQAPLPRTGMVAGCSISQNLPLGAVAHGFAEEMCCPA